MPGKGTNTKFDHSGKIEENNHTRTSNDQNNHKLAMTVQRLSVTTEITFCSARSS